MGEGRAGRVGPVGLTVVLLAMLGGCVAEAPDSLLDPSVRGAEVVDLPDPDTQGSVPLESTLATRRSSREFAPDELSPGTIGQLLWAGQGVTSSTGYRTAPSAGAAKAQNAPRIPLSMTGPKLPPRLYARGSPATRRATPTANRGAILAR